MVNTFALSFIRLIQRLSMLVTLGCLAYVIFFFFAKNKDNSVSMNDTVAPSKATVALTATPVFDLKPFDASGAKARDIFSLAVAVPAPGATPQTPKGQLPGNLKVVGILVGHPSQIVIEDSSVNSTYFINEGAAQAGISVKKVNNNQVILNYQGQDIDVPVVKN